MMENPMKELAMEKLASVSNALFPVEDYSPILQGAILESMWDFYKDKEDEKILLYLNVCLRWNLEQAGIE